MPSAGSRTKPGPCRTEGQGRLRTSGVCPASSGRQSASGRSGPVGQEVGGRAPGRHSAGSRNVYKGPLPGRAGALRRGASLRACGPLRTSPGKEDSAESQVETVGLGARRRGVGARPGLANARGVTAPGGARREARLGPRAGEGAGGPRATAEAPIVTASTTASRRFYPEARRASGSPTPGVEEGGQGAGKGRGLRGHEPGAAPGRAPPAGRGSRPGPAQGGGARRQGAPCAVVATRKPDTQVVRSKCGKPRVGQQAREAALAPTGASRGPALGLRP